MANGKGQLDCFYCAHFRTPPQTCAFHTHVLPRKEIGHLNLVCSQFEEGDRSESIYRMKAQFGEVASHLKEGILYAFSYASHDRASDLKPVLTFPKDEKKI